MGDGSAIPSTLLGALGANEDGLRPAIETVKDRLAISPALTIFDNCEHLVAEVAETITDLLRSCPSLTVLATSREPLALPGEVVWRVPSLTLPPRGLALHLDTVDAFDSCALFLDRARLARRDLRLAAGQVEAIGEICQRLDGVALAIELAAARCGQMSPVGILKDRDQQFRLLAGATRARLPRHQTMLASVQWSHNLLTPDEQSMLRRLDVFAGAFSLRAAEGVASRFGDVDEWSVRELLGRLVDKNLVVLEHIDDGRADRRDDRYDGETMTYRLYETIRQFAIERSQDAGELTNLRDAHAKCGAKSSVDWISQHIRQS